MGQVHQEKRDIRVELDRQLESHQKVVAELSQTKEDFSQYKQKHQ